MRLLTAACLCLPLLAALSPARAASSVVIAPETPDPKLNAMLPEDIRASGVLTIATDAHYPPCESLLADNTTMVGYEPDMWNAIGQKLGITIKAVSTDFDGLIPGVQSGRYPMAMECISDSATREKQVTFIDNSFGAMAGYALSGTEGLSDDPLSLCGRKTATQVGTDFVDALKAMSDHCTSVGKPAIAVSQFPSADAALLALFSGRVDFVLSDAAAVDDLQSHAPKPLIVFTNAYMPKQYLGMVVKPEAKALAEATLAALQAVIADGTYGKIMEKWNIKILELNEPGINLATTKPLPAP